MHRYTQIHTQDTTGETHVGGCSADLDDGLLPESPTPTDADDADAAVVVIVLRRLRWVSTTDRAAIDRRIESKAVPCTLPYNLEAPS